MSSELSIPGRDNLPAESSSWGENRERRAVERKVRVDAARQAAQQRKDHRRRLIEQENKGQRTVYGVAVIKQTVEAVDDIVGDDPYLGSLVGAHSKEERVGSSTRSEVLRGWRDIPHREFSEARHRRNALERPGIS